MATPKPHQLMPNQDEAMSCNVQSLHCIANPLGKSNMIKCLEDLSTCEPKGWVNSSAGKLPQKSG